MPAAKGPVTRELLHAAAKVDGKLVRWIVGAFANEASIKHFAAMLKMAYKTADDAGIAAMDVHRPTLKDGQTMEIPVFSRSTVQYNPQAPGLDDDAALA